jgi:hypothetical protein
MFKIELDDEAIMVMEREDDKIFVADKEIGVTRELETGDSLADGSVEIKEEGVVFQPPRADQQPFVIPSREEFMPMASFKADKDRIKLDDKLEERHNNEMIILMVEDSDRLR